MRDGRPLVLAATVSLEERGWLERTFEAAGFAFSQADDATNAEKELCDRSADGVLVIDSGLLTMAHDASWRAFRRQHPEIGTVIRCWAPRSQPRSVGDRTYEVHPDDSDGLLRAVRALVAAVRGA